MRVRFPLSAPFLRGVVGTRHGGLKPRWASLPVPVRLTRFARGLAPHLLVRRSASLHRPREQIGGRAWNSRPGGLKNRRAHQARERASRSGRTSLRSPRSGSRRLPRHSPRSAGVGGPRPMTRATTGRPDFFRRVVERIHTSLRNSRAKAHAGASPVSPTNASRPRRTRVVRQPLKLDIGARFSAWLPLSPCS
jgi:hypothetical protein